MTRGEFAFACAEIVEKVKDNTMQKVIAIEEMSELMQAISKDIRGIGHYNRQNIIEEVADVKIMLQQLEYIYHINPVDLYKVIEKKIERTRERLNEERTVR